MPFVKVTDEMVQAALRETDWAAIDAMTDEDIARQVSENPDAAPLMTDAEFAKSDFSCRVKRIRQNLALSQSSFAIRFRIPINSLQDWEQGRRMPDAATRAYLAVIEQEPDAVIRALAASD